MNQDKNHDSDELRGQRLLHTPLLNKGTAFTEAERDALGLRGLLPPKVFTQEEQVSRVLENFHRKESDIERYIYMSALQDRNERLFYRVIMDHIETMMPIIYTPTVGEACRKYAHIRRRSRGLYVAATHRGRIPEVLRNWPERNIRVIVVTDGERILGLGDLGANGIGIPIGKLSLYTACAGIPPEQTLPILLDVGTNNHELLADPVYPGLDQERLRGDEYDELVDEFVFAVQDVFPDALIQFEDFGNANAFRLLDKYRDRICTFNDDIQGTAAVSLSGILSALRLTGGSLAGQRILFLGAGTAALGIGELIVKALVDSGVTETDARRVCWFVDSRGLVVSGRDNVSSKKAAFAHEHPYAATLLEATKSLRPTVLIGVSGQGSAFTREVVETMASHNEQPIIFALSNPTSVSECTAEEAYAWSNGRAIFASGSPFDPVEINGETRIPGQGNNAYIFPGVGLGVVASRASRVTDSMFLVAARSLASQVDEASLQHGRVYPPLSEIRDVSLKIAIDVYHESHRLGLAREPLHDNVGDAIAGLRFDALYPEYV